ncbi:Hsp70 family protein [Actinosynnema sp. NPDC020468]|uniref:Hsp70 family protein n=1 Tax=Actinosynnema sp. NPDC020468 TaxID=3154488 RepID=UPI0033D05C97
MPYVLGVDAGTTRTTAALCRLGGAGRAEPELPAVGFATSLLLRPDGTVVVGEFGDPRLSATGFTGRVGDRTPVALGADLCPAEELTALVVRSVVDRVTAQEGSGPAHVVLTSSPGWGPTTRKGLLDALAAVGVPDVSLLPEPLAVAENHAFLHGPPPALGVFSLGGHAFRAAVVRGREVVRFAEGVDQAAGVDFDDLVFGHVREVLGRELTGLPADDPRTSALYARLRRDCEAAKRLLSGLPETRLPVHLPSGSVEVPLTRARFEQLVRPALDQALAVFERTARGLGVEVTALVGGSARIPLLAALAPGRVVFEAAPETSAVKGAALHARRVLEGDAEPEPVPTSVLVRYDDPSLRFPVGALDYVDDDFTAPPPRPPVDITPLDLPERRTVKRVVRGLAVTGRRSADPEDGR